MLSLPRTWKTYVGEPNFNCASANVLWTCGCSETFKGSPPGQQVEILLKPEGDWPLPCQQLFSISWPLKFFSYSSQGPSKEPEKSSQDANQITSWKPLNIFHCFGIKTNVLPIAWDSNVGCHLSCERFWPHQEYTPTPHPSREGHPL